jgi:hypothetical protein
MYVRSPSTAKSGRQPPMLFHFTFAQSKRERSIRQHECARNSHVLGFVPLPRVACLVTPHCCCCWIHAPYLDEQKDEDGRGVRAYVSVSVVRVRVRVRCACAVCVRGVRDKTPTLDCIRFPAREKARGRQHGPNMQHTQNTTKCKDLANPSTAAGSRWTSESKMSI